MLSNRILSQTTKNVNIRHVNFLTFLESVQIFCPPYVYVFKTRRSNSDTLMKTHKEINYQFATCLFCCPNKSVSFLFNVEYVIDNTGQRRYAQDLICLLLSFDLFKWFQSHFETCSCRPLGPWTLLASGPSEAIVPWAPGLPKPPGSLCSLSPRTVWTLACPNPLSSFAYWKMIGYSASLVVLIITSHLHGY